MNTYLRLNLKNVEGRHTIMFRIQQIQRTGQKGRGVGLVVAGIDKQAGFRILKGLQHPHDGLPLIAGSRQRTDGVENVGSIRTAVLVDTELTGAVSVPEPAAVSSVREPVALHDTVDFLNNRVDSIVFPYAIFHSEIIVSRYGILDI